jgi:hypothetical protein
MERVGTSCGALAALLSNAWGARHLKVVCCVAVRTQGKLLLKLRRLVTCCFGSMFEGQQAAA